MAIPMSQSGREEAMRAAETVKGRSLWQDARRRLFRNKATVVSMIVLSIIILLAIFAPYLSIHRYDTQDYNQVGCYPSSMIDMGKLNPPEGAEPGSAAYKAYEQYNEEYPERVQCGLAIGWCERIARQQVQQVGQDQFLVLLLVLQAEREHRPGILRQVALEHREDALVDGAPVGNHFA